METKSVDESKLIDYLLGETSEEETEQFDELSITDDEFAARLSTAEHELVDSYARGELSGRLRDRFVTHYLASNRRRGNLESAKTFLAYVDKSEPRAAPEVPTKERKARVPIWGSFLSFPSLKWGFAALSLLVLLAGGFLIFQNLRLRDQLKDLGAQRQLLQLRERELEDQLAERRSASTEVERELAEIRDRQAKLDKQLGGTAPAESNGAHIVAFNLLAPLRGAAQPPEFRIPDTATVINLNVETDATDFPAYRVELKETSGGRTVWQSGRLKLDTTGKSVRVSLRANLVSAQNYALQLTGLRSNGMAEKIGSYAFKVVK